MTAEHRRRVTSFFGLSIAFWLIAVLNVPDVSSQIIANCRKPVLTFVVTRNGVQQFDYSDSFLRTILNEENLLQAVSHNAAFASATDVAIDAKVTLPGIRSLSYDYDGDQVWFPDGTAAVKTVSKFPFFFGSGSATLPYRSSSKSKFDALRWVREQLQNAIKNGHTFPNPAKNLWLRIEYAGGRRRLRLADGHATASDGKNTDGLRLNGSSATCFDEMDLVEDVGK